jgi:2-O-methyltransferase
LEKEFLINFTQQLVTRFPFLNILRVVYNYIRNGLPPVSYTPLDATLLQKCLNKDNPIILEIGCNDGTHTSWFLKIFKNPTIYCFEPDPKAIVHFKEKIRNHKNVKLFEIALSDRDGEANFHQSNGTEQEWTGSGSLREPKEHLKVHPQIKFDRQISVVTSRLDTWCNQNDIENIDFIWMDVQGAEIDVFNGGVNALKNTRFLYTEYSDRELYKDQLNLHGLIKHLKKYDFKILRRYHGDALFTSGKL